MGVIFRRKVPFLISRWHAVEPLFRFLFKSKIHPYYTFPFKDKFIQSDFDFATGETAKGSNEPNKVFDQLIKDSRKSTDEVEIYTDGSKTKSDIINSNDNLVGCAIFIPCINKEIVYKLNPLTSSFMVEVLAIDKVLSLVDSHPWSRVNICSDSQSVLVALKNAEKSFFPRAINKLNTVLADLSYKLSRINFNEGRVRFTWCPAHVGIEGNERADRLAKEASVKGETWNNLISYKEISSSMVSKYRKIDTNNSYFSEVGSVGSYFLKNFCNFNIRRIKCLTKNREDCKTLTRIITGYPGTNLYLFRLRVKDSPDCPCEAVVQDMNHIFCPAHY